MTGLQKQTFSINLGTGINTDIDTKVANPNEFKQIKNCWLDKQKRLDKRYGTDKLSTTIQTDFTKSTPLTIGSSNIKSMVINHEDQLLLQNKGALYSYLEGQSKWQFKGHYYPLEVSSKVVQSNEFDLTNPYSGQLNGYTVVAYRVSTPGGQQVRYSLIEQATGNYIVEDAIVEQGNSTDQISYIRVIAFSSKIYIGWQKANDFSLREVNTATGALGSVIGLIGNAKSVTNISNRAPISFVYTNKAGVGERVFLAYVTTGNILTVRSIDNTGNFDGTMGTFTTGATIGGLSIDYNTAGDYLSVVYEFDNTVVSQILTFTSTAITAGSLLNLLVLDSEIPNFDIWAIVQCASPTTPAQQYVFFDWYRPLSFISSVSRDNFLYQSVISSSSVVQSASVIGYSLQIAAQPILDTTRSTIYLPMAYISPLQSTCFLVDILKGKNESAHYVLAKWNYGLFNESADGSCPPLLLDTNSNYFFAHELNTRIVSFGTLLDDAPEAFNTGIATSFINLTPEYAGSTEYIAQGTYFSGGYLGTYDGAQFNEQGFFVEPEFIRVSQPTTSARIGLTVVQQGTASVPEITEVTCADAVLNLRGPTNYWTFNTTTTTVNVYYIINGTGSAPAVPGTNIGVTLTGQESGSEVARKTIEAIINAGLNCFITQPSGIAVNTFTITNSANGSVTDASSANYTSSATGAAAGTYTYSAVFFAIDARGQVIRSRPLSNYLFTAANTNERSVLLEAPPITNRQVSQVLCQIYRTVLNGTVLRVLSTFNVSPAFAATGFTVNFLDNIVDGSLSNETLYTTGDVLPNYSVPACRAVTSFKNRLMCVPVDLNFPIYSKTVLPGAPVEMVEENQLTVNFDDELVTGLKQLDDKLIIGKERKLFYVAGDGVNDLGQGSTFSLPTLIASDVGVLNQNSMEVYDLGLMFNSDKGIYILSRSLQASRIGRPADDFKTNKVSKSVLNKIDSQIRFIFQDIDQALCYNYEDNFWHQFAPYGGTSATLWQDQFVRCDSSGGVYVENKTKWIDDGSTTETYTQFIETHWLKIKNVQDYQRVYRAGFLGELKTACTATVKVYTDYDETSFDTYTFLSSAISPSVVYQFIMHLKRQKSEAIKLSIEITPTGSNSEQGVTLTDMSFEVGVKQGLMKLAKARKI